MRVCQNQMPAPVPCLHFVSAKRGIGSLWRTCSARVSERASPASLPRSRAAPKRRESGETPLKEEQKGWEKALK